MKHYSMSLRHTDSFVLFFNAENDEDAFNKVEAIEDSSLEEAIEELSAEVESSFTSFYENLEEEGVKLNWSPIPQPAKIKQNKKARKLPYSVIFNSTNEGVVFWDSINADKAKIVAQKLAEDKVGPENLNDGDFKIKYSSEKVFGLTRGGTVLVKKSKKKSTKV
jgi:hypothetical protein